LLGSLFLMSATICGDREMLSAALVAKAGRLALCSSIPTGTDQHISLCNWMEEALLRRRLPAWEGLSPHLLWQLCPSGRPLSPAHSLSCFSPASHLLLLSASFSLSLFSLLPLSNSQESFRKPGKEGGGMHLSQDSLTGGSTGLQILSASLSLKGRKAASLCTLSLVRHACFDSESISHHSLFSLCCLSTFSLYTMLRCSYITPYVCTTSLSSGGISLLIC